MVNLKYTATKKDVLQTNFPFSAFKLRDPLSLSRSLTFTNKTSLLCLTPAAHDVPSCAKVPKNPNDCFLLKVTPP